MSVDLKPPKQMRLNFQRAPAYLPAEFSIGASNRQAVERLEAWETWHNSSLALIGPESSGKTHLARLWAERVGAEICSAGQDLCPTNLDGPLVLEDADQIEHPEFLFHRLNQSAQNGSALLLTSRTLPGAWPADLPDLRSRLNALQVVELAPPDDEVLADILRAFFKSRNIRPAEDIYPYLMARMERSVAAARDLVDRIDETADTLGRPVSKAIAREVLGDDTENLDLFEG